MRQKQYQQPPRRRHHRPRRKRSNGLAGFFLSVIVLAIVFFGASLFFKVHFIEISGTEKCNPQDIRAVSGITEDDFLFYINKRSASSAILSDQAYVDTIKIKTKLPNIVNIEITECVPLAYIKQFNNHWIVDIRGKLLENVSDKPELPEITGFVLLQPLTGTVMEIGVKDEYKTAPILELLELLNEMEIKIETIEFDTALGISFTYLGRFKVIVGMPELFDHKLERLIAYVEQLEPNATGTIYLPEDGGRVGRFVPN